MMEYPYEIEVANIDRLTVEIEQSAIATALTSITFFDGNLSIIFDSELSTGDENILDGLIENHTDSPIPEDVTPRQIRQALILSGVSMQQITDALNTLPSPQKELALAEWEYSTAFIRSNPLVASVGAMLGWTNQQLDDLWVYAGTL